MRRRRSSAMASRRHSLLIALAAGAIGLLLWGWDDLLGSQSGNLLHTILGGAEFIILGPGLAALAYLVSERARLAHLALEAERERARLQRLAALGRVAAGLAHEVRNPLHNLRLLLEEAAAAEAGERAALMARADANIHRIDRAVELVYRLARRRQAAASDESAELATAIAAAVAQERARSGAAIAVAMPPAAQVAVPADDLAIALDNLLRNATAAAAGAEVSVSAERSGASWRITVRNPGLLPPDLAALMRGDEAPSGKPGGLGLGLAISRQLIVECGGSLELRQDGSVVEALLALPEAAP